MNIEEFYDADERRRESEELELGNEWSDSSRRLFDLSYVVATGELYLMAAPDAAIAEDTFGDVMALPKPVEELSVEVLAVLRSVDELHEVLRGWEDQMAKPDSVGWLRSQVPAANG